MHACPNYPSDLALEHWDSVPQYTTATELTTIQNGDPELKLQKCLKKTCKAICFLKYTLLKH